MNTFATQKAAPSAGGADTNSADAPAVVAADSGLAESTAPAQSLVGTRSTASVIKSDVSFCCAFWDYLRRITEDEPNAADYGLEEPYAEVLRRQCTIEFNDRKVAAARAAATFRAPSQRSAT